MWYTFILTGKIKSDETVEKFLWHDPPTLLGGYLRVNHRSLSGGHGGPKQFPIFYIKGSVETTTPAINKDEVAKHDSIEDMLRFRAHALNRGKYFIVKKRSVSLVHHFGD